MVVVIVNDTCDAQPYLLISGHFNAQVLVETPKPLIQDKLGWLNHISYIMMKQVHCEIIFIY